VRLSLLMGSIKSKARQNQRSYQRSVSHPKLMRIFLSTGTIDISADASKLMLEYLQHLLTLREGYSLFLLSNEAIFLNNQE